MLRKSLPKKKRFLSHRKGGMILLFICVVLTLSLSVLFGKFTSSTCGNSLSCITDLTGEYEMGATSGEFLKQIVTVPSAIAYSPTTKVLGATDAANKRIEVDLANQMLHAFENDTEVMSFPISSGLWGKTPTGTFSVWIKLRYTRMKGGSEALGTYYNLPNVPYTMFFYNDQIPKWRGFGIHGAYWHNNFGHPMSHGCINVGLADIERLYNWATPVSSSGTTLATADNPGTKIIIYGVAPNQ